MGTLILHAGMPKAGSSSIQSWLAESAGDLRDRHGVATAVARVQRTVGQPDELRLLIYQPRETPKKTMEGRTQQAKDLQREAQRVNSAPFIRAFTRTRGAGPDEAILASFVEQLDALAEQHPRIVVSCEGFGSLLAASGRFRAFIDALEQLTRRHQVRVAYYVRPQHSALEASWRQWGFRSPTRPSVWLTAKSGELHYLRTLSTMNSVAPHVSFEVRPFRSDLLYLQSPVADFAEHFLGAGEYAAGFRDTSVNVGLPLELVIALRDGPAELIGRDMHDNRGIRRVQKLFGDMRVEPDARIARSRTVLQAYCHDRFEAENVELFAALGWEASEFVPPVELTEWDLREIDSGWRPYASEAERAFLYKAILAAIS